MIFYLMIFCSFFSTFLVKRYTFTSSQVGLMFIVGGITYILTQLFVVMPFSKFFEPSKIIRVTMLLMALPSLSVFVFEDLRYLSVFLIVYIMSLAVTFPNLLALISNNVSAEKQGNIIGLLWSSQALVTVIGTFVGGFLAAYNIYSPIIIGGSFLFASWLLFLYSFAAKSPSA